MLLNCNVGEDLRVPWTARRSNQSILKEISPECSLEELMAETPILWPPDVKSWLIWKDPNAGKDWGQKEKGTTEDEMAGWHHRLNGHGFEWTPGVGVGQGGLAYCSSWGHKESDMTELLSWTKMSKIRCSKKVIVVNKARLKRKEYNWTFQEQYLNFSFSYNVSYPNVFVYLSVHHLSHSLEYESLKLGI